MKPDYYLCDVCGSKTQERMFVQTGREMDAAGSMDTVGRDLDLCGKCAVSILIRLQKKSEGFIIGKSIIEAACAVKGGPLR